MTDTEFVQLTGSDRKPLDDAQLIGPADPDEWLELTVVTRRMASLPGTPDGTLARLSRAELRQSYGSAQADHDLVASVLTGLDPAIEVTDADPGSRRMTVAGPSAVLAGAFGTELSQVM
ncbi:MAG: hypothetical protein ACRDOK_06860, partial [Streptosporangiaceae bacterium]